MNLSRLFFILNLAVKLLERFYVCVSIFLNIQDPFGSCSCSGNGSHIGNSCLDCGLAQITVIMNTVFSNR